MTLSNSWHKDKWKSCTIDVFNILTKIVCQPADDSQYSLLFANSKYKYLRTVAIV